MPSTAISSSTLAAPTPRTPPKRCSSFARFFAPMPAISSSLLLPVRTLARLARMPVIAKRCASSRICATSINAAESAGSVNFSRPSANTSSSSPTLRPSPFSTPTMREMSSPSEWNTSRAIDTWPRPPSTSTRSGRRVPDDFRVDAASATPASTAAPANAASTNASALPALSAASGAPVSGSDCASAASACGTGAEASAAASSGESGCTSMRVAFASIAVAGVATTGTTPKRE